MFQSRDQKIHQTKEDDIERLEDMQTGDTSGGADQLSNAPTELLAKEYRRLMEQYEAELRNREKLEDELANMRE